MKVYPFELLRLNAQLHAQYRAYKKAATDFFDGQVSYEFKEEQGEAWEDLFNQHRRRKTLYRSHAVGCDIFGTVVPTQEQGSSNEVRYVGPKKLVSADGKPIDPAICQV